MDISIIIVSYNTVEILHDCLQSIERGAGGLAYEVIVVDNASNDGSVDMIKRDFPDVRVIGNTENKGFAAANNQGLRHASGDFLFLLNSDTILREGALLRLVEFMRDKGPGIAGCMLVNPDGTIQPSVRSFPTLINVLSEAFFLHKLMPRSNVFGRYYMGSFDYSRPSTVDWVMGAAILVHHSVLERIGLLDERFFMFGEEVDFCYRASRSGFDTWYFPGATIVHRWGGSPQTKFARILWVKGSQLMLFEKHFRGVLKAALYVALMAGILVRVPVYTVQGILSMNAETIRKAWNFGRVFFVLPVRFFRNEVFMKGPA